MTIRYTPTSCKGDCWWTLSTPHYLHVGTIAACERCGRLWVVRRISRYHNKWRRLRWYHFCSRRHLHEENRNDQNGG